MRSDVEKIILKHALKNAIKYGGKANLKAVLSKVFGELPELRKEAKEVVKLAREIVEKINSLSREEQIDLFKKEFPNEPLEEEKKEFVKELPPLPNVDKWGRVVTRFAPNPDFVLHLGSARPAILSYEYARRYKGKFILRFEDTDPKTKRPLLEAYYLIRDELRWLGLKWDEEYIQSLRMEIYYDIARKLIEKGGAYVDLCKDEEWKKYRDEKKPCPHRNQSIEEALELFDKMLEGYFGEGEAVVRVKTDMAHPDPAVRDWVAFRIIDTSKYPHPIVRDRYIVWPTYNFAAAVDDHLMGVTHILRAKEHLQNTVKQSYLYKHMGWRYPETIHFGRLKLEGVVLSKSKIRKGIEDGLFSGYDDIRLGTLEALRRRGILPETIWQIVLDVGVKPTEASVSLDNIYSINRKLLDPKAKRLMFVKDPVKMVVSGIDKSLEFNAPLHPTNKELGTRKLEVIPRNGEAVIYVSREDISVMKPGSTIRLMEAFNVKIVEVSDKEIKAEFAGTELVKGIPIVQWVAEGRYVNAYVEVPVYTGDVPEIRVDKGFVETYALSLDIGEVVQFVRYGFVKLDRVVPDRLHFIYTHN